MNDKIAEELRTPDNIVEILKNNPDASPQAVSAMLAAKVAQEAQKHQ